MIKTTIPSRCSETDARMRVAFVPVWDGNPYHSELIAALRRIGVQVSDVHTLKEVFRRNGEIDVVHVHALPYFDCNPINIVRYVSFYRRLKVLQDRGVRLVWTVHDFQNHDSVFNVLEQRMSQWLSSRADALIVHGKSAQEMIAKKWGAKRISVVPHGNYISSYPNTISRDAARATFGFDDSHTVFLFLGLIRPYKGVEEMVRCFKRCAAPGARLVIAGSPLNEVIRRRIATEAESDRRILFHAGFVEEEGVQRYMNASDVVVFPYRKVLTSGAAVLAMSFGKTCIVPMTGCMGDILDTSGAFFFDPTREEDLENAMGHAVVCRQRLAEMGQSNLGRVRQWDWDSVARKTARIYQACSD